MPMGVPVIQANALFDASYQSYRHSESHKTIVRTVIYVPPATLHRQVLPVVPMTASGGLAGRLMKSASGQPATMLSSRVDQVGVPALAVQHIRLYAHYYDGSECGHDYGIFKGYPSWAGLYEFR